MSGMSSPPQVPDVQIQDNLALLAMQIMEVGAVAGIEKYVDGFVDQFEDSTGVAVATNADYDAVGDQYKLTTTITNQLTGGTVSASTESNPAADALDGNVGTFWQATGTGACWWKYDLGAGNEKMLTRLQVLGQGNCMDAFTVEVSNNDSAWTNVFTGNMANNTNWQTFTLTTAANWRYYRVSCSTNFDGGAANRPVVCEFRFGVVAPYFAISNVAVTAETNDPLSVRLIALVDLNSLSLTPNTQFVGEVSINGGTNWETVVFTYEGLDGTGRAIYSGTKEPTPRATKSMVYRLTVNNSKNVFIKGVAVFWKY